MLNLLNSSFYSFGINQKKNVGYFKQSHEHSSWGYKRLLYYFFVAIRHSVLLDFKEEN